MFVWREGMIPDYPTDLNAMHEAERILTPEQEENYVALLGQLIMSKAYDGDERWVKSHLSSGDSTYRATAAQRCEAFLGVLGKWKYDQPSKEAAP